MNPRFTRKQLADSAEVGVEAIRFYESLGILPEPERSASGYRLYRQEDVARVRYVKRAQELGFSLNEIRDLIALTTSPSASRADMRVRASIKMREIRAKIADLKKMADILDRLVEECDGKGKIAGCPIFEYMNPNKPAKAGRNR